VRKEGSRFFIQLEVLSGDAAGEVVEIEHGEDADSLSDTGQDRAQRAQFA